MAKAHVFLENDFKFKHIDDFKQAGIVPIKYGYLYDYLYEQYSDVDNVLIWNDVILEPQDEHIKEINCEYFIQDNDVCFVSSSKGLSIERIKQFVLFSKVSWHFLLLIFKNDESLSINNIADKLTGSFLEENLQEVIVGAFDGEGYVHYYTE